MPINRIFATAGSDGFSAPVPEPLNRKVPRILSCRQWWRCTFGPYTVYVGLDLLFTTRRRWDRQWSAGRLRWGVWRVGPFTVAHNLRTLTRAQYERASAEAETGVFRELQDYEA